MSHYSTRRAFLAAAACAIPLAACTVTTANGVTTVTVQLATIDAYAQAVKNGTAALLANPVISGALGAAVVAAINAAETDVTNSISALDTANAGSISLTFSTASVPAALTSLQADAKTILGDVQTVFTSLGTQIGSDVVQTFDAFETIVSLLVAIGSAAVGAPAVKMTQAQALSVLGVQAP